MKLTKLIPNIFYSDIRVGLNLFVDCLGFTLLYDDKGEEGRFCIIERDNVKIHLIEDDEFARRDRPAIRIETDNIAAVFEMVREKNPELLHPNAKEITRKPWGTREFAVRDESDVCVAIVQSDD